MYELVKIYSHLNQHLFEGLLDNPIFETNLKFKEIFHFDSERTIIIGLGFAKETKIHRIIDEMLHVMIHVSNHKKGIIDKTQNHYHKQAFVDVALDFGLFVGKIRSRGWGFVTSSQADCKGLKVQIPEIESQRKLFEIYHSMDLDEEKLIEHQKRLKETIGSKRVFLLKYRCQCPAPHNTVRSGRRPDGKNGPNITCNLCNTRFFCDS